MRGHRSTWPVDKGPGGVIYAEDELVALTQLERLQRAFSVLTGLFDRVGLRKNTRKTVSMVCQKCHMPVRMSVEAY